MNEQFEIVDKQFEVVDEEFEIGDNQFQISHKNDFKFHRKKEKTDYSQQLFFRNQSKQTEFEDGHRKC